MTNKQLYASVKASFVSKESSLHKWCLAKGVKRQNARDALLGIWKGQKGKELRDLLIKESGVEVGNSEGQVANQSCQLDDVVGNS